MVNYYFVPTDETLHKCIGSVYKVPDELCFYYSLFDENCRDKQMLIVKQHSYFINLLIEKLRLSNFTKYNCTSTITTITDEIILFFGLGVDDITSYRLYSKYYIASHYILDWGKIFTIKKFNYKDKLEYYKFIESKSSNVFIPTYHQIENIDILREKLEPTQIYLLKDITGSGGGGIYPIIKDESGRIIKLNEDNSSVEFVQEESITKFFVQKFVLPITVSGIQIILCLFKPDNIPEVYHIDEESKRKLISSDPKNNFKKLFQFISVNIDVNNKILLCIYFAIDGTTQNSYIEVVKRVLEYFKNDADRNLMYDTIREISDDNTIDTFKLFISFLRVFNTEKGFGLKFRRPYLHFCSPDGFTDIQSFDKFDIDIIFDFEEDLSLPTSEYKFKNFISNYTSGNNIYLDELCKKMNSNKGIYLLFDKYFSSEQKEKILSSEKIIMKDLKDSIEVHPSLKTYKNKVYFKHYANDYIIGHDFNLYVLEVNDSPVIQKNQSEFADFLIKFITDNYDFRTGFLPQDGGFNKVKFLSNLENKYLMKYYKYKSKYSQLKKLK